MPTLEGRDRDRAGDVLLQLGPQLVLSSRVDALEGPLQSPVRMRRVPVVTEPAAVAAERQLPARVSLLLKRSDASPAVGAQQRSRLAVGVVVVPVVKQPRGGAALGKDNGELTFGKLGKGLAPFSMQLVDLVVGVDAADVAEDEVRHFAHMLVLTGVSALPVVGDGRRHPGDDE